ncbi:MAG: EutN/CcmL family microcompartment protein [Gemmatimonadaceae bacterium]
MHLARVMGRLVATVKQETLTAIPLQWIQPLTATGESAGKPIVAIDRVGVGPGEVVVYITSREAAMMLEEPLAAVDAGIVAKVDWCHVVPKRAPGDERSEPRAQERTLDA